MADVDGFFKTHLRRRRPRPASLVQPSPEVPVGRAAGVAGIGDRGEDHRGPKV
ncbi:MAG TPA: hypothetical protein VGR26_17605 [Acidimicrobiales bacterium]|nr:hypothetical protein [Acidimicrobiales bacterium]